MANKPNCYKCKYRGTISGDAHSRCKNPDAKVKGHPGGIKGGWFRHPINFDPTWLLECDGFEQSKPISSQSHTSVPKNTDRAL